MAGFCGQTFTPKVLARALGKAQDREMAKDEAESWRRIRLGGAWTPFDLTQESSEGLATLRGDVLAGRVSDRTAVARLALATADMTAAQLSDLAVGAHHVRMTLGAPTLADVVLSALASALFGWLP